MNGCLEIENLTGPLSQRWQHTVRRIAAALEAARDCELTVIYATNSAPRIALERSEFGAHFRRSWGNDFASGKE